jgi:hypothetical protein
MDEKLIDDFVQLFQRREVKFDDKTILACHAVTFDDLG